MIVFFFLIRFEIVLVLSLKNDSIETWVFGAFWNLLKSQLLLGPPLTESWLVKGALPHRRQVDSEVSGDIQWGGPPCHR